MGVDATKRKRGAPVKNPAQESSSAPEKQRQAKMTTKDLECTDCDLNFTYRTSPEKKHQFED
jgi:hypothetical protein